MQAPGLKGMQETDILALKEIMVSQGAKRGSEDRVWSPLSEENTRNARRVQQESSLPAEGTWWSNRIQWKLWTHLHAISGVYRFLEAQFWVFSRAHGPENKMPRSNPSCHLVLLMRKLKLRRGKLPAHGHSQTSLSIPSPSVFLTKQSVPTRFCSTPRSHRRMPSEHHLKHRNRLRPEGGRHLPERPLPTCKEALKPEAVLPTSPVLSSPNPHEPPSWRNLLWASPWLKDIQWDSTAWKTAQSSIEDLPRCGHDTSFKSYFPYSSPCTLSSRQREHPLTPYLFTFAHACPSLPACLPFPSESCPSCKVQLRSRVARLHLESWLVPMCQPHSLRGRSVTFL